MDRYLLKNIIIIILLLANGFLLGVLAMRQAAAFNARQQAEEQLAALFAADEMTLEAGAISREAPPPSLSLSRSTRREQNMAAFFLGKSMIREDQGGGTYTYTSDTGVARFHANGSFDVAGTLSFSEPEALCREFCAAFSYDEPVFSLDAGGSGTGTATYRHGKLSVFNCAVTFTVNQGTLLTVSGILLPEEGTAVTTDQEPLSASAALLAFQKMRRESGAVASTVTGMYPCYELQGVSASVLSLVPAWCVVTDIANYYVNCMTGAVTSI